MWLPAPRRKSRPANRRHHHPRQRQPVQKRRRTGWPHLSHQARQQSGSHVCPQWPAEEANVTVADRNKLFASRVDDAEKRRPRPARTSKLGITVHALTVRTGRATGPDRHQGVLVTEVKPDSVCRRPWRCARSGDSPDQPPAGGQ